MPTAFFIFPLILKLSRISLDDYEAHPATYRKFPTITLASFTSEST
jgi:hypothetical protein